MDLTLLLVNDKNLNEMNNDQENTNGLEGDNTVKNPDDWTTGDEPMTGVQGVISQNSVR